MDIWFYIWAIIVVLLSVIYLYKYDLGCSGFIVVLLFQIFILSVTYLEDNKVTGIAFSLAIITQSFISTLFLSNSLLETIFKSFKYKAVLIPLIHIIAISIFILYIYLGMP